MLLESSGATTAVAGLGAVFAGVKGIQSLVTTVKTLVDPKNDKETSWLLHGLQSLLLGGLSTGLAAPFLNIRSPFIKIINGKELVQLKMIAGAVVAPLLLSVFMATAKGVSFMNNIPGIGTALKDITSPINNSVKAVTTSGDAYTRDAGLPAGGLGAGAGANPFAQAA